MRTCRVLLCGLLLMALVPVLSSASVTLSQQIITSAAQSGEGGTTRLDGSLGGLIMHPASGGLMALAQGFWFPGQFDIIGVNEDTGGEYRFSLNQNYPNPFNPRTAISFTVPGSSGSVQTRLDLYDVSGRVVRTLTNEQLPPGPHAAVWDGRNDDGRPVATGVYFAHLRSGGLTATKQLVLLK
jgi:hypothetical protein